MSNIYLKRLRKEQQKFIEDPCEDYTANPVQDDLFCWHFTIRGPKDTEFETGIYHGIIKLPTNYPIKPPSVTFLTPNGRFDTNMDICLSMTQYHKEEWQSVWTIKTMLEAIIAFMPIKEDHDAIGAVDCSKEMRKNYATMSHNYKCDVCGNVCEILKPRETKKEKEDKGKENKEIAETLKEMITSFKDNKEGEEMEQNDNRTLNDVIKYKDNTNVQENRNINNEPMKDFLNEEKEIRNVDMNCNKNSNEEYMQNYKKQLQDNNQYTSIQKEPLPPFYEEFLEEFSFYKIQNTIKCHYTKSKDEIDSEIKLLQNNQQPSLTSPPFSSLITNNTTSPQHTSQSNIHPLFTSNNSSSTPSTPPDLESKIKQRIYFNKVLTRETYDKTKKEKLRNLNLTMLVIMSSIIILYYSITKFFY